MKKIVILFVALFAAAFLNAQTVVTWNVADSNHGIIEVIHPIVTYDTAFSDTTIISIDTMYNYNEWFLIAKANDGILFDYWVNVWKTDDTIVYDTIDSNFNLIDIDGSTYDSVSCVAYFMEYVSIENINMENILLYPNPTTGIIRFKTPIGDFHIYNQNGLEIISGTNAEAIDLSNYKSDIYILKTRNTVSKIVKL